MKVQLALDLVGGHSASPAKPVRRRPKGIERCESPIEEQLCLALGFAGLFRWREPDDHPWRVGHWPAIDLALFAQPEWGAFRLDFALAPLEWMYPEPLPVVIEVDGHEFHERTKEQAERDRARDRFMAAHGATVLRFTGSEVWRNAGRCAEEILALVSRRQRGRIHP